MNDARNRGREPKAKPSQTRALIFLLPALMKQDGFDGLRQLNPIRVLFQEGHYMIILVA